MTTCEQFNNGVRQHRDPNYAWWEYDARGIPLVQVCKYCRKEKLAQYRPEVLTDPNYEADEPIDEDGVPGDYDRDIY